MKLFLTSAGLPLETVEEFLKLLYKDPKKTNVCFITTASNPETDKWYVEKDLNGLKKLGFDVTEVDLKQENKTSLERKLKNFDVIFVEGGNTFYLLKYVRKSGFGDVLKTFLNRGGVYVGVSAGSMIAGVNIESAGWKHADRNIVNIKNLIGLKLVPFVISVHVDESNIETIKDCAHKVNYPVVALSDRQAILVKEKTIKIVGFGEKHIFNNSDSLKL